jgi:hypothetical protein
VVFDNVPLLLSRLGDVRVRGARSLDARDVLFHICLLRGASQFLRGVSPRVRDVLLLHFLP